MKRFKVSLNGFKLGIIEARTEQLALERAAYLYGMEITLEELL